MFSLSPMVTIKFNNKKPCCHTEAARCFGLFVVSFNSTIPRAQSFIISFSASNLPMRTIKFCSVLFGVSGLLS